MATIDDEFEAVKPRWRKHPCECCGYFVMDRHPANDTVCSDCGNAGRRLLKFHDQVHEFKVVVDDLAREESGFKDAAKYLHELETRVIGLLESRYPRRAESKREGGG